MKILWPPPAALACFVACSFITLSAPSIVESQGGGPSAQSGDINLDLSSDQDTESYSAIQDRAISAFRTLAEGTKSLAQGGSIAPTSLDDNVLMYLSGVYLFCAVNNGTCPLVLESVLEVDVINSRLSGSVACPNMKRFWNAWVRSDMEERHRFLIKTSHMNAHNQFNTQTRPKFLKCEDTIKEEMRGFTSSQAFFRERYASESPKAKLFSSMVSLLSQLKEKVPNVFVATGSQAAGGGGSPAKGAKPQAKTRKSSTR